MSATRFSPLKINWELGGIFIENFINTLSQVIPFECRQYYFLHGYAPVI